MTDRDARLARGLASLLKCIIVVLGVPVALVRLARVSALPRPLLSLHALSTASLWLHVVLVLVGLAWLWACASLARGLLDAWREPEGHVRPGWSSRWATGVVGLIVVLSGPLWASARTTTPVSPRSPIGAEALAQPRERSSATVSTIEPGEGLDDFSDRTLGRSDAWGAIARANLNRLQPDGRRVVDPNLIRPGWWFELPEGSTSTAEAGVPVGHAAQSPQQANIAGRLEDLALFGLGLLTIAGLARRTRVLKRLSACLRRPSERMRAPEEEVGELDAVLSSFGQSSLLEWIDAANRLLWLGLRSRPVGLPLPDVLLVRAGPDGIELLLSEVLEAAPAPFRSEGRWWRLDPTVGPIEARRLSSGAGRFLPWLLPVGDDGSAAYLVAVGPGRQLGIRGENELVDAMLSSLTVSLRVLPWASELEVALVGEPLPSALEQSYHVEQASAASLEDLAERPARELHTRLERVWHEEPFIALGRDVQLEESLIERANARAGLLGALKSATFSLEVGPTSSLLSPFGLELISSAPNKAQLELVNRLLVNCTTYAEEAHPEDDEPKVPRPDAQGTDTGEPFSLVELQLLKDTPRLSGELRELAARDLARVTELVCYLSLHGNRAPRAEVLRALFSASTRASHDVAFEHLFGAARAALGRGLNGQTLLRRTDDDLVLDSACTSDWSRMHRAIERAASLSAAEAIEALRGALSLLERRPFADPLIGYRWVIAQGIDEWIGACIIDGAHHLASLAIAGNNHDLARWAIGKGRLIEPASEILVRDLMASYEQTGEHELVTETFVELEAELAELDGNEPSPETRAFYEQLLKGHPDSEHARRP